MSSSLVSVLHQEERSIVAELRASKPFQRLEAIRRLLALYDAQPSVATGLDAPASAGPDRAGGEVIHFTSSVAPPAAVHVPPPIPAPVVAPPPPVASSIPLPSPAPSPAPKPAPTPAPAAATQVAAIAEAAVADVVVRAPAPPAQGAESETSSVVSSVRAALLGIGKG